MNPNYEVIIIKKPLSIIRKLKIFTGISNWGSSNSESFAGPEGEREYSQ